MASAWSSGQSLHLPRFGQVPHSSEPSHPLRVLLVEDDADTAESMAVLLRLWGHQIHVASDGPCALESGIAFQPHVVLLDLRLPGMDGFQVARHFREQPALRDATLVALTGYGDDANRRRSWHAGIDLHLVKPVNPDRLRDLLSAMTTERAFLQEGEGVRCPTVAV